jgi:non-heme chloroperoxidase
VVLAEQTAELPTGVELPYVRHGDPSGIPVVFVHAIADSWHAFELVLPHLPDSIHAIVPSQRGHGDATRPDSGYRPADFANDLTAFIDVLELERVVVVGGSSGGFVARRFALDHPDRTLGLVFLGSPRSLRDKPEVMEMWDTTLSKLTDPIDPVFVREFAERTLANTVPERFLDTMVQENLRVPARVWIETMAGLLEDDSVDRLGAITAPTLIIWGDRDGVLPASDQEALASAIPRARLAVYRGTGHAVYWEEPERVASDLVGFVEGLEVR